MINWGISANSHDAALAVFVDQRLAFASHSERFSGIKNDPDLCDQLVEYAIERYGPPQRIYWYERPWLKTLRQLRAGQGLQDNNIKKYLKSYNITAPITTTAHHHSHAAAGYYTSGVDHACVLVIDAIGEFETVTIWRGEGLKLTKLWSQSYPHSVGLFYSAMTDRIGLKPNEDEYILMGMAAYGNKQTVLPEMTTSYIESFDDVKFKQNLHRGCKEWLPNAASYYDIAAATQHVYEEFFKSLLKKAQQLTNSKNLVLMGGCALNCTANRLTGKYFDRTWIMPNPGDAGSSIGTVLAHNPKWRINSKYFSPYLGLDMGGQVKHEEIAKYLMEHKICGVARGRAEFGPRALGNRSLLADPRGNDIKDRVNEIKQRQQFRPFAPAILEEYAHRYFDMPVGWADSRFMQVTAKCKRPDLYPAIVHVDDTSRVQTVPDDGSMFRTLLEHWHEMTGCPMLLNTSLNIKGQPMVNDRSQATAFEQQYHVKVFT